MSFRDAPYIGPLVRNQLDAEKDAVDMTSTGPGVEVMHKGARYMVPWSNVKCVEFA